MRTTNCALVVERQAEAVQSFRRPAGLQQFSFKNPAIRDSQHLHKQQGSRAMTRRAFYSFHYANDAWRAATVRNIGTFEESEPVSDNEWETIKKGGKAAIESWIQSQMEGRGVVVVLIGSETYKRPWVLYEIQQGYELNKVMVGIYIHNLKNAAGDVSAKGQNPFAFVKDSKGVALSSKFHAFDPPGSNSKDVYAAISDQLKKWFP